jgi:hypothetical protein
MLRYPTISRDMLNNLSVLLNKQHLCGRFRHAREKVGELLLSLSSIPGNGGAVWLAGHSLGASIALEVGRDLMSRMGRNLPTFLFNPPHVSLAPAIGEEARRDVYTMGYIGKYLLGWVLRGHRDHMDELFRKLSPWVPNLYVHPEDPICKGFIDYFEQRGRVGHHAVVPGHAPLCVRHAEGTAAPLTIGRWCGRTGAGTATGTGSGSVGAPRLGLEEAGAEPQAIHVALNVLCACSVCNLFDSEGVCNFRSFGMLYEF